MIRYTISNNNKGFGQIQIHQDYDLACVIVEVEDTVAKVTIEEIEMVLKAIKNENER